MSERFVYEVRRICEDFAVDPATLEVARQPDLLMETQLFRVTRRICAWRPPDGGVLVVRWPANWWQHLKSRFFPAWALRRWPVLEHVETYRAAAYLPTVPVPAPGHGLAVWHTWDRGDTAENWPLSDRPRGAEGGS